MRSDLRDKNSKTVKRTMTAFSNALFKLLEERSLESITIGTLCEACDYPRATFYNYFTDIYDLLNYCFSLIKVELDIEKYVKIPDGQKTKFLFGVFYDYMTNPDNWFLKAMVNNPHDGSFIREVRDYIRSQIEIIMKNVKATESFPVAGPVMAQHYSNTIELVLSHSLLGEERMSREQALEAVDFLLCTLERESRKPQEVY